MTRRRWIAGKWSAATAALEGEQAVHLARVLRGEPGMRCEVVTGETVWLAVATEVSEARVEFRLEQEVEAERALPLTLVLAVFKFDRFEWAIEKATELGVERVAPVIARRTDKHLGQAAVARVERWRRIAREAAQQSRRSDVPMVSDVRPLSGALDEVWEGSKLLLAESERGVMLRDALQGTRVVMAVGPEGGWTEEEEKTFGEQGWTAVSLGPRILRAETAAVAATALAAARLG